MIEDILSQILQKNLKISPKGFTLTKLQGDASYRIYYRLQVEDGRSFIVMQLPAGKSSASEEITHLKEKPQELPFINIAKDLKKKGLPVPEIFHDEKEAGIILLEDFGDETLEKKLQKGSAAEQDHWYQKAIDLLILFQEKCRQKNADCVAYQRSFDTTLLQWEFDHFIEYGIEARTGLKINEDDLKEIRRWTNFITFALAQLPQILVHRDFQSRNIMIYNDSLKLLDFQDALLGPQPYDLVALLRDSYIQLPWEQVSRLIDYYLSHDEAKDEAKTDKILFRKMFDWMTIQRKLKDAGRFVYIDRIKKNPSFLKHIPASLSYVKGAIERQAELKVFFEVLKKYVPEFGI